MKLSLRAARKLETKIGKYLDEDTLKTSVKVRVNTTTDNLVSALNSAREKTKKDFEEKLGLSSVRYTVRNLISKANASTGINDLISQKVSEENTLKQLKAVLTSEPRLEADELGDTLKLGQKRFEQAAPDQYGSRDNPVVTSFSVLTSADLEEYKKRATKLQRSVESVDNSLDALNHSAQVELTSEAVVLLQKHQLL